MSTPSTSTARGGSFPSTPASSTSQSWRYNCRAYREHRKMLVTSVLALYNSDTNTQRLARIFEQAISPDITFRDPLVEVHGSLDYASQFTALRSIFHSFQLHDVELSGTYDTLAIHASAEYVLAPPSPPSVTTPTSSSSSSSSSALVPQSSSSTTSVATTTNSSSSSSSSFSRFLSLLSPFSSYLTLRLRLQQITLIRISDEGLGRIVSHEDVWSVSDVIEQLPVIGRAYMFGKRTMGIISSAIIRHTVSKNEMHELKQSLGFGAASKSNMATIGGGAQTTSFLLLERQQGEQEEEKQRLLDDDDDNDTSISAGKAARPPSECDTITTPTTQTTKTTETTTAVTAANARAALSFITSTTSAAAACALLETQ